MEIKLKRFFEIGIIIPLFAIVLFATVPQPSFAAGSTARWVLHKFPAHRTELQSFHRSQIGFVTSEIIASFTVPSVATDDRVRCLRIIGHAATWKGISKAEYGRRALARAKGAAEELTDQIGTFGLVSKIFLVSDDLGLEDSEECEPVSGIDVTVIVGDKANDEPLKPNLVNRTDSEARENRALNRRVEIFVDKVVVPQPSTPLQKNIPQCNNKGSVCVIRNDGGPYEGLYCWWRGNFWGSDEDLDDLVAEGKAEYACDSR